jgi:hypothetical protein
MHAGCIPVCGNLFHHAVEMLLKGGLSRKRKLSQLKSMGHQLKLLWREFKSDFPDPALKKHDRTISLLDKFEAIRYPDSIVRFGMGAGAQWSGPAPSVTVRGPGLKTPKQYTVVVSEIDDLLVDVFRNLSLKPGAFIGTNRAGRQAITRFNRHRKFLTKFP